VAEVGGARDLTGQRLGPYRLEAALGAGAFGGRYGARHVLLDSPRVVEVCDGRGTGFREAARAAARLEHADAATVLDFGIDGELEYLVMDPAEPVEPPVRPAVSRPRRPGARRLVAAAAAIVLGTGMVVAVARATPPAPARSAAAPAAVGVPMEAAGLTVTLLSVDVDAVPPPAARPGAAGRFVAVAVLVRDTGSAPAPVSPYDWAVSDAGGGVYGAVVDGLDGPLAERTLPPGRSERGRIGFVVPRTAQGLRLHFDAELGNGAAQVPLT
jgi:Domain of unknown function (DUF4352)